MSSLGHLRPGRSGRNSTSMPRKVESWRSGLQQWHELGSPPRCSPECRQDLTCVLVLSHTSESIHPPGIALLLAVMRPCLRLALPGRLCAACGQPGPGRASQMRQLLALDQSVSIIPKHATLHLSEGPWPVESHGVEGQWPTLSRNKYCQGKRVRDIKLLI